MEQLAWPMYPPTRESLIAQKPCTLEPGSYVGAAGSPGGLGLIADGVEVSTQIELERTRRSPLARPAKTR